MSRARSRCWLAIRICERAWVKKRVRAWLIGVGRERFGSSGKRRVCKFASVAALSERRICIVGRHGSAERAVIHAFVGGQRDRRYKGSGQRPPLQGGRFWQ